MCFHCNMLHSHLVLASKSLHLHSSRMHRVMHVQCQGVATHLWAMRLQYVVQTGGGPHICELGVDSSSTASLHSVSQYSNR